MVCSYLRFRTFGSLVGPSGLEPPTSCLSGTRSNLLSYEPLGLVKWFLFTWWWRWWDSVSRELRARSSTVANVHRKFALHRFPFESSLLFVTNLSPLSLLGGDDGIRTHDPLLAGQVLSQLSYTPKFIGLFYFDSRKLSLPRSCWHWAIFPGRFQPSIFATAELNFCVRNGNRWTLCVCSTDFFLKNPWSLNIEQQSFL